SGVAAVPACTVAVPTSLFGGQLDWAAWAAPLVAAAAAIALAGQCGGPASLAIIPGARVTEAAFSSCPPFRRAIAAWSGLKAPAWLFFGAAAKDGAKGRAARVAAQDPPPGVAWREKLDTGVTAGLPEYGVIRAEPEFGPQVGGLLSTACWPPTKSSLKLVN